ncbi:SURP and G-patch domain-containing protein 1-like protein [Apostasia shenzhenica]|uniref:SURP and G-patch domain-containing protein 1-like protein n=1 Tax=Apostasia shenzhenica TaxID=1088818 RepID=A0A2H9ZWP3_9ASPA|nr:SURP and G-patch domain-containing protein 1-like protein [Apostasia shenzhenica]
MTVLASGQSSKVLLIWAKALHRMGEEEMGWSSKAIDSSNIGFRMLKKCGWKEGAGLGAFEQGRLDPVQTQVKKNKRGIGAEKRKRSDINSTESTSESKMEKERLQCKKKQKAISKRFKKIQEHEERMKEKEFERAFFREFWPDNV